MSKRILAKAERRPATAAADTLAAPRR